MDVVLNKILEMVRREIDSFRNTPEASQTILQVEEKDKWAIAGVPSLREEEPQVRVLPGGRVVAIYTMADEGLLGYDSEITYRVTAPSGDSSDVVDIVVLEHLKEVTRSELSCQVCYGLFLDPLTTTCGHTFCRKCIHRVLDHSNLCPVCRRPMIIAPGVSAKQAPSNVLLGKLLNGLCPEALAARVQAAKLEDATGMGELDTPLFVCTLSFPCTPTFLHIFEPKYRLMIRRAVESGDRKFGMVLYNPKREPQGHLGPVPFFQYGTMLHIVNMQVMPDGRSLIETVGVSRFRVLQSGTVDGYTVGKVERVDDISIAEEEALEASETASPSTPRHFSAQDTFGAPLHQTLMTTDPPPPTLDYDNISTQDLMITSLSFVKKMREQSASWLHRRVFHAYGEPPDDPAIFPWWFASVLPTADAEKYKLLATSSVRERLKMCAGWIAGIEAHGLYGLLSSPSSSQEGTAE